MLIFSIPFSDLIKNFLLYGGFGVKRRPKDRVTLQIILVATLTHPKTFTQGHVSVSGKYIYIHCNKISLTVKIWTCKCK
jgi:hypothetical protein